MSEAVGQDFIRKTPETPKAREKLSDEGMGNLVSAIGNSEAKAITLILMKSGGIHSKVSLHEQIINAQGARKGWEMAKTVPFGYCSWTLAPVGLVAKETFGPDLSTFGYSITEHGQKIGVPLAGLLLDFSERHNISLNKLFGATTSSSKAKFIKTEGVEDIEFKKRSPSTTIKIFFELLTSPGLPIREGDIVKKIGADNFQTINTSLFRLAEIGLIEYSSIEVNRPYSKYKISPDTPVGEFPTFRTYPRMTKLIFDILKQHPDEYLTIKDVYNLIPQDVKKGWKDGSLGTIANILSFLAKQKYAGIENFKYKKQSEISVTDEQKIILTELLEIIDGIQNLDSDILEKGRGLAEKIIVNPHRVSALLGRAKEASNRANQPSVRESQENILSIILANPGITNKEIRKLLEEKYEKKSGIANITKLSSSLVKQGLIREEKQGTVNKFFVH